ncbi:acyltransferase [Microvirga sp. ACRRW]|uniref:acyltransferase family protein n=1 Tax=Microvirga sp. ACRRW TaxID=2918205 RepID=UPI001EF521B6|nr:acyltransferase family protein [Microvirga sp. ACRRW]MCG7393250.1 acyltransferase [Microvirga sp. ACRRW]
MRLGYRADIDGLRAISVLAVLFFHVEFTQFSGGFVGVDVFFVISGYLITKIIKIDAENGTFSFKRFYVRRIWRLFPALLTTIAISYVAGFFIFSSEDFMNLSASTIYAILSLSNIYFWLQSGYFDAGATLKPLLHTWSLSVEEQFYLVWPAIIVFLARKRAWILPLVIGALGIGSFVDALSGLDTNPVATFFLSPFRIYEFALGALVVWAERYRPKAPLLNDAAYLFGLGLIIYAILSFDEKTVFPGTAALVPALGTAMAIHAGRTARPAAVVANRVMVGIGLISYSLYLVHWPIVVFTKYFLLETEWTHSVFMILASFAAALILYRFVEQPFREARGANEPAKLPPFPLSLCAYAAPLLLIATMSWAQSGWVWRLPTELREINNFSPEEMRRHTWAAPYALRGRRFTTQKIKVVVAGDSQAADLINMLISGGYEAFVEIRYIRIVSSCGIVDPAGEDADKYWYDGNFRTASDPRLITRCIKENNTFLTSKLLERADAVIIASHWYDYNLPYIPDVLARLEQSTKAPVYIAGRKDLRRSSVQIANAHGRLAGLEAYASNERNEDAQNINATLKLISKDRFIDLMALLCPSKDKCAVLSEGQPIFFDHTHITPAGAKYFGKKLMQSGILKEFTRPPKL